ncbi:MAG: hypothetical protein ABIV94_08325 [Acidimicrobiales bacterium]
MRTAGRIFAGLFMGVVLFVGLGGAAQAQTPGQSQSQSQSQSQNTTPSSSTRTTVRAGTGSTSGGSLAKTGTDLGVPIALGGGALVITMVLRRVLAND